MRGVEVDAQAFRGVIVSESVLPIALFLLFFAFGCRVALGDEALDLGIVFLKAAQQARFLDGEIVELAAIVRKICASSKPLRTASFSSPANCEANSRRPMA